MQPSVLYIEPISQYDVMNHFLTCYLKEFKKRGYELYPINKGVPSAINNNKSFIFYYGNPRINEQSFFQEHFNLLPIVNILVDHPFLYFPFETVRSSHLPVVVMPDWLDVEGYNEFCDVLAWVFQPHLAYPHPNLVHPVCASKREIDVLFTGSIASPRAIEEDFRQKYPNLWSIFETVIHFLRNQENVPLDHLLRTSFSFNSGDSKIKLDCFRVLYAYLDRYLRNLYRLNTLKALTNTNSHVHYYGNNPQLASKLLENPINFNFNNSVGFIEALRLMQNSKIVLTSSYQNNMALLSERGLSAMANGAVSVQGGSAFLSRLFKEDEEVISYRWLDGLSALPHTIENILSDKDRLDFIAINGQHRVNSDYTVEKATNSLLHNIEFFRDRYYLTKNT